MKQLKIYLYTLPQTVKCLLFNLDYLKEERWKLKKGLIAG